MNSGLSTFDYLLKTEGLYHEILQFMKTGNDDWETKKQYSPLIAWFKEAALRSHQIGEKITKLSTSDVDASVVAYALKVTQLVTENSRMCDQLALFFAYQKDFDQTYSGFSLTNLVSSAFNGFFGTHLNRQQRTAYERLEKMKLANQEAETKLGVGISILRAEGDSLCKMMAEKYEWE